MSSFEDRHGADPQPCKFASAPRPTPCRARMPGQYPIDGGLRLRLCGEAEEADATARLYLCARCQAQVLICSCCDRGNIYCARECAEVVRRSAQREAGKRYQATDRGRRNHAERARKYRAQKKVTHQGSPLQRTDDLISEGWAITPSTLRPRRSLPHFPREAPLRCHWCGCRCSPFVRSGFLRRRRGADP